MAWNNFQQVSGSSIWEDISTGEIFDAETSWYSPHAATGASGFNSNNIYFIAKTENFINGNSHHDSDFVKKYCAPLYGEDITYTQEVMYSNLDALEKFKNSKILVVAGGPSATERQWDPDDYDYVFSCNHFYLNKKLNKIDVAYAILGDEVDMSLGNDRMNDYLRTNSTIVCLDNRVTNLAHQLPRKRNKARETISFLNKQYPNRHMFIHFRYKSKVGTGTRLILSALLFGARQIHFVGVDGMAPGTKVGDVHNHAFQRGKKFNSPNLSYDRWRRHYTAFWHYMINELKAHEKVELQNLGEGPRCNQSTDISRQLFPLMK